jgi:hypothetical protein
MRMLLRRELLGQVKIRKKLVVTIIIIAAAVIIIIIKTDKKMESRK